MRDENRRNRRGLAGVFRLRRMGSGGDHRGQGLRGSCERGHRAHHGGARIEKHADADGVSRIFEEGSGAGVGHRAGVNSTNPERGDNELSWPTSTHAARRLIMRAVPRATAMDLAAAESEARGRADEPPILATPNVLEGTALKAIRVAPPRGARLESAFAGFLDGAQDVRVVNHCDGLPIVWATVSAAVRIRRNRRLTAWARRAPLVSRRYYLPLRYLEDIAA